MEMKLDYSDISFKNNGKLKLLIIVGTRPEIIRLAAVINKCRKYFDCILDPKGEQARRDEEMRREQELANAKMEYLEQLAEFDESRLPRHPAEKGQEKGVGTVVFAVVALVVLVIAMLLFG